LESNYYIEFISILLNCFLILYFGIVLYFDLLIRKIFNKLILIGMIFGLIYGTWMNGIASTLLGGVIGFSLMFIVYLLGNILMPSIAKWRNLTLRNKAIYRNDVLLGLISGLILGFGLIDSGLFISLLFFCFVGLIYIPYKIIKKEYSPDLSLPVSPFIITGSLFVLFYPVFQKII